MVSERTKREKRQEKKRPQNTITQLLNKKTKNREEIQCPSTVVVTES